MTEAAAAQFVRTASAERGAAAGTVRITASEVIGIEVLPPILAALRRREPALAFELDVTNSVENVLRGDADIAVRMLAPAQSELIAQRVGSMELGFYADAGWVAAHGEPATLAELIASGALVGYDRSPLILHALAERGFDAAPSDFGFRSDSDLARLAALRAGFGPALC